jgi:transcriptional regulator with XRE-family HTH domain
LQDETASKRTPRRTTPLEAKLADGSIRKCLNIGDALRDLVTELMRRHGWSENQVAKYLGVPQQTLNTFTRKGKSMRLDTFSKFLDASVAWELIGWIREQAEESALKEEARLAALPRGVKRRGRPRKI